LDTVERKFALLYQQQLTWTYLKNLPTKLSANGAACASDKHHFAKNIFC
jgi:hypothetical protein